MIPKLLFQCLVTIGLSIWCAGCSPGNKEKEAETAKAKPSQEESRVKHGTNGEVVITVSAETQKIMGLQTAELAAASFKSEVKGFGRVLDASSLAMLVLEMASAQEVSNASEADLKRLKALAAQGNASAHALQTAVVTAGRDQAQVNSARLRLVAGWGRVIAVRQDLPTLAQSLLMVNTIIIQVDVPAGEWADEAPTGARLSLMTDDPDKANFIESKYVSPAPTVDTQTQGRGFLFLVETNRSGLVPGMAVVGYLKRPGDALKGVAVPESAVVRHENKAWVYVQKDAVNFMRQEVVLNQPTTDGWFVTAGVQPNERVVVAGAQTLLSEELKSQTRLND